MKVLVLAGGFDQIIFIKKLKKLGHKVILADYYENPPAKEYADKHYQVSTLDEEAIFDLAKKEKVELIATACTDQALLTVAKVSERIGLSCYIDTKTALNVTNKQYMKEIFYKNNIPTSKYKIINNISDCEELEIAYPLVVKPCDCNSSKGVKKVANKTELLKNLEEALKISRTHTAIVEEFKEGIELSIDVFSENYKIKLLSYSCTEKIKNNNTFTIYKSVYPVSGVTNEVENKIIDVAGKIAKAFKLKNSPILIQAILQDGDINVIEFSARMGGGTKYKLIETISGVNIMDEYINLLLNKPLQIIPKKQVNFAELNYCYCNNGTIKEFDGFDELKDENVILDYFKYKTIGTKINQALNSGDRAAGFLIVADSKEELIQKRNKANSTIKILNEKNIDIYIRM